MFEEPERIIDLTHPIDNQMPVWPTFPPLRVEQTAWAARDGFTMERVEMRTHTGTHMDAPLHFIPEGKTLDEFPVSAFVGSGVVLDLTPKEPGDAITVTDIEPFEEGIETGDVVMLHTGWDAYYGLTTEYLFEFPYLTAEASEYLAGMDIKAVGTEAMSVGGWVDEVPAHGPTTEVGADESHLPLLENDVFPIEELCRLDDVLDGAESRRAYFLFPPLDFRNTSGSSVRAFAFL